MVLGIIGWYGHSRGICLSRCSYIARVGLASGCLDLPVEGLVLFEAVPGDVLGTPTQQGKGCLLVPDKVVVGFTKIEGVVAVLPHDLRQQFHALGQGDLHGSA